MATDSQTCYMISDNYVSSSNQYLPCGNPSSAGGQSCCFAGDYCMQDNICYYTDSVVNGTGYYMAGCTDPTWSDPGCPQQCTSEYDGTIIYDTTNAHWDCCSSTEDSLNCQQPSDFIVNAPAPEQLVLLRNLSTPVPSPALTTGIGAISTTVAGGFSTGTATASSTATSATATLSSNSVSPPAGDTTGLSGGALAAITISIIGAIAFLVAIIFIARRRNRRTNTNNTRSLPPNIQHDRYNELNRSFAFPSPGSEQQHSPQFYPFPSPSMMEINAPHANQTYQSYQQYQNYQQYPSDTSLPLAEAESPGLVPYHLPPGSPHFAPARDSHELPMSPQDEQVARMQSPRTRFNGKATELEGDLAKRGELPGSQPPRRPFSFEPAYVPRSPRSPGGSRLRETGYFAG